MSQAVKALWAYRGFIAGSVKREFQSKYRNSLLGVAWNVINPLAMIAVYTVIFSQVMRAKLPGVENSFGYSIYLCAGVLTWGLFAEITTRAQNMFLDSANLLKKLRFPRLCLPVIVVTSALVNFAIVFGLFTGFLIATGSFSGSAYLALIPLLALLVLFATGLGVLLGVLNVFFRDIGQFFGIFITFWFWLTPIVYPATILPVTAKELMGFNPMANLIEAVQGVVLKGMWPVWETLLYPLLLSVIMAVLAWRLFRKRSREMVDEL